MTLNNSPLQRTGWLRKITLTGALTLGLVSCVVPGAIVVQSEPARIGTGGPHTMSLYTADTLNNGGSRALSMPQTERQLEAILQRLIIHIPGGMIPGGEVRIHPDATGFYKARAADTNDIYIGLGLLAQAESEDEVAFTIAHELAHIALAHNSSNSIIEFWRDSVDTMGEAASLVTALGVQYAGVDEGDFRDVIYGSIAAAQLTEIAATSIYNRREELAADIMGYDLFIAAGYDRAALSPVFTKMEGADAAIVSFLEQNSANIQRQAEGLLATGNLDVIREGLRQLVQQVGLQAARDLGRIAADTHPSAQTRNDNIQEHARRPDAPTSTGTMDTRAWANWQQRTNIAAWSRDMGSLDASNRLLTDGRPSEAIRGLRGAISRRGNQPALVQQLALAYFADGNGSRARSTLRSLPSSSIVAFETTRAWSTSEAGSGNPTQASRIADRIENQFGRQNSQPVRVANAVIDGDAGAVEFAVAQCAELPSKVSLQCHRIAAGLNAGGGDGDADTGGGWSFGERMEEARQRLFGSGSN